MNIIIDNKEVFINANNISTVKPLTVDPIDVTNNTYEIKMNNGDKFQIEYFSFLYFRNYSSGDYASFSLKQYLKPYGAKEEFLQKNKYIEGTVIIGGSGGTTNPDNPPSNLTVRELSVSRNESINGSSLKFEIQDRETEVL